MRPIDIQSYAAITQPASLGPAPQLQWLPIDQLVIDESYQRDITAQGRKNVRAIAENFSWTFFAPVIVSPIEDGRYAVIDGQHRTTAAMLVGVKEVPCALVIADKITQAKAFRAINAQVTKMHPCQIFHARTAAGEEEACRAHAMAQAAGVKIMKYAGGWQRNLSNTIAVDAVTRMAKANAEIGTLTLRCLVSAGGYEDKNCLRSTAIAALFDVLADHPEWCRDEAAVIAAVECLPICEMLSRAKIAAEQIKGTTTGDQLQASLVDALEKSFRRQAA
jgi:hypothetical protein